VQEQREVRASLALEAVASSPARARQFIRDICNAAKLGTDVCETAALLTSELVTNAVKYGGSRATLEAAVPGEVLRVAITDENPALPVVGLRPALGDESGRGLKLVSALASRWGVERTPSGGKAVWFELEMQPDP
jgi:anti-sigma regulatory factor (Ser/Thr protein kinase)